MPELSERGAGESSSIIRSRVIAARELQARRYSAHSSLREDGPGSGIYCNAQMTSRLLREVCIIVKSGQKLLKKAMGQLALSVRAHDRILKVSRTIADLAGTETIRPEHLAEAIQYRILDRQGWTG